MVAGADGTPLRLTEHGELIVGNTKHSIPFNATRSTAGVSNVVPLVTNNSFIVTYLVVASDRTNVETIVSVYETRTVDGNTATAENMILSGSLAKSDRVILSGLDLETLSSRFINIETDTAATINVTIMGYYEVNGYSDGS